MEDRNRVGPPDVAIVIADKALKTERKKKQEASEEGRRSIYKAMSKDLLQAVKDGDDKLLAKLLEALSTMKG